MTARNPRTDESSLRVRAYQWLRLAKLLLTVLLLAVTLWTALGAI